MRVNDIRSLHIKTKIIEQITFMDEYEWTCLKGQRVPERGEGEV